MTLGIFQFGSPRRRSYGGAQRARRVTERKAVARGVLGTAVGGLGLPRTPRVAQRLREGLPQSRPEQRGFSTLGLGHGALPHAEPIGSGLLGKSEPGSPFREVGPGQTSQVLLGRRGRVGRPRT